MADKTACCCGCCMTNKSQTVQIVTRALLPALHFIDEHEVDDQVVTSDELNVPSDEPP